MLFNDYSIIVLYFLNKTILLHWEWLFLKMFPSKINLALHVYKKSFFLLLFILKSAILYLTSYSYLVCFPPISLSFWKHTHRYAVGWFLNVTRPNMTEVMETGLLLFVCLEYVCVKIATLSILTFWTPTSSLGVGKHKAGHKTDVYKKKF